MHIELSLSLLVYPFFAILIYWPCLNGEPIFDDHDILKVTNEFRWSWAHISGAYRPITQLSYALQAKWPATFRSLHVGNVLFHAVCGLIIEQIAQTLHANPVTAFCAGLLWVAHPYAVNTVGYITGRASIISTAFGLAALWAILEPHQSHWAILLLGFSILSKEDGIGFAVLSLALGIWTHQYFFAGILVSGIVGFTIWQWPRLREYQKGNGDSAMEAIGLPVAHKQPAHGWTVFVETIIRIPLWAFGAGTSPYYGSGVKVPGIRRANYAFYILAGLAALAINFPYMRLPLLLIFLGPWLVYILCRVPDQLFDYRNYAMTAGFTLLFLPLLDIPFVDVALIASAATCTVFFAFKWSDPLQMWAEAATSTAGDRSRACQELGAHYKIRGDLRLAEKYLREALAANHRLAPAITNLSWTLTEQKKHEEARYWIEQLPERCPRYALGWENLGLLRDDQGKPEEAEQAYRRAIELDSNMHVSLNRLGLHAFYRKDFAEADALFERALSLNSRALEYAYNHAVTLKHQGKPEFKEWFARFPQQCPITPNMIRVEFAQ